MKLGVTALPNCSCATRVVEVCAVRRECGSYGNALSVSTPVVKVLATKQAACDGIEKKICKANSKPVSSSPLSVTHFQQSTFRPKQAPGRASSKPSGLVQFPNAPPQSHHGTASWQKHIEVSANTWCQRNGSAKNAHCLTLSQPLGALALPVKLWKVGADLQNQRDLRK